jgi:hypothetical protein
MILSFLDQFNFAHQLQIKLNFVNKINFNGKDDCWEWMGGKCYGYGIFSVNRGNKKKSFRAHRFAYTLQNGEIDLELVLDHLCENKSCVNPGHLEAVTVKENTFRCKKAPSTINKDKVFCKHGHEFDIENTYIYSSGTHKGERKCRKCHQIQEQMRRKKCQ